MNDQQSCTLQNFDLALLDQLRAECDVHAIDLSRCKMTPLGNGRYTLAFDKPVTDIGRFCPGAPTQLTARSAGQGEGLMLLWCKRIQVGERQAVRHGVVCGWDSARINREPLTADELARHRRHLEELALQRKIAAELVAAVEERQKAADDAAAKDLRERYPDSMAAPRKTPKKQAQQPVPGKTTTVGIMQ